MWTKSVQEFTDDEMNISGHVIQTKRGKLKHGALRYWVKNPRIYSIVHASEAPLDQAEIELELQSREHVKQLTRDIKHHGGLIDPIIVVDDSFEVIEGNSRLAAIRWLSHKVDPIKFGELRCIVLPREVDDAVIYSYLNQEHMEGKTEWSPYEQAGVIYRLIESGMTTDNLSTEMNITKQKAQKMFDVYEFMVDHGEDKPHRYSYYDVYLSNRKAKARRAIEPRLDSRIIETVRRKDMTAQEFRKKLPMVCKHRKQFNKFVTGRSSLLGAFEALEEQGKTDSLVVRLRKMHDQVRRIEKKEFDGLDAKAQQNAKYRLNKIITEVQNLKQKVYGSE